MKRLIQPQHANRRRAGDLGCIAVICLAALVAALTVGCGGTAHSSTLAYVSNSTGTGFTVFSINNNGTLTTASVSPQNTGIAPKLLQISANGKWAYFLNNTSTVDGCSPGGCIYGFTRSGNGAFQEAITGSPFPLTSAGSSLVISPNNLFVYAAVPGSNEVAIFRIEQSTGQLIQLGSNKPVGAAITHLAIAPDGLALYGLAPTQQAVLGFRIPDPLIGSIVNSNSPGSIGPSAPDYGLILSVDGNFIYVPDKTQTDTFTTNGNVNGTGVTFTGQSPTIYGFSTKTNGVEGALQPIPGVVFHENADLSPLAEQPPNPAQYPTLPVAGATSNDSRWLFIANQGSHNVSVFDIHSLGGAAPIEVQGTVTSTNGVPSSTASPFNCGAGCSMTPTFIAVSKSNNAIYALDTNTARIFQFALEQNTGRLRPLSPASVDAGPTPVWITIK
jgi:6-phosphogluconolactonase (cycloisomerase 2 family)